MTESRSLAQVLADLDAREAAAKRAATVWNAAHPVGTLVRYWPVMGQQTSKVATTRTPAWAIPSGAALVSITGQAGGVNLTHVKAISVADALVDELPYSTIPDTEDAQHVIDWLRPHIEAALREEIAEELAEARSWARHGYEIGQRSYTWADEGIAPKWLTQPTALGDAGGERDDQ